MRASLYAVRRVVVKPLACPFRIVTCCPKFGPGMMSKSTSVEPALVVLPVLAMALPGLPGTELLERTKALCGRAGTSPEDRVDVPEFKNSPAGGISAGRSVLMRYLWLTL